MRRGPGLLAVLACSLAALAQTSNTAKTGGSCSPAITGSSNQIVINCNGLSAAKASQLVVLMNRILAERLDVSEVNSKLDQLHSDIGGLSAAINPLANAPAPVLAILKRSDVLLTQCTNLVSDWSERSVSAMQAATKASTEDAYAEVGAQIEAQRARESSRRGATSEVDQPKAQEFLSTYAPRLNALNASLHRLMPDAPAVAGISSNATASQASQYAFQVFMLAQRYKQQQAQQGRAADPRLLNEATNLFQDANLFCRSWQQADLDAMRVQRAAPRPPKTMPSTPADASAPIDAEETAKYMSTLEPQLVAFRDTVLPRVPEFSSGRDYADVKSLIQLNNVCLDVRNLGMAYRQMAIDEQQHHTAATAAKAR